MNFTGMIDKAAITTYEHPYLTGGAVASVGAVDALNTHRAMKKGSNHPYASGLARTGAMGMTVAGGTALGMRHGRPLMESGWSHAKGLGLLP